MITTKLELPVMSSWMQFNGRRLDCNPYLSGAFEAKVLLEKLRAKKQPLHELTEGRREGIYHAGREGRTYVDDPKYGVPFLGSTDILAADLSKLSLLSKKQVAANPQFTIKEGWTLITRSGTIGRMAYVRSDMAGMACSEHVMRVVPDTDKIPSGYAYAYLSSTFGMPIVVSGTYGAIIQHIEPDHIAALPVPRLGEEVEGQAHELIIQAARMRTKALGLLYQSGRHMLELVGLEELPEEYNVERPLTSEIMFHNLRMRLEGAFHSPLALEAERSVKRAYCKVLPLSDEQVAKKLFKPNIFKRAWVDSDEYGVPFVSGNDVYRINPSPERYISNKFKGIKNYLLKKGMVVFQAAGQLNGIFGFPIVANSHLDGMFCADDVFRIIPHSAADAGYIYAYLRTNYGQRLIKRQAYGYSIPRVVAEHVGQVLIPWPTEEERRVIGEPVMNAWEDLAKAIRVEDNAVKLVEKTIRQG